MSESKSKNVIVFGASPNPSRYSHIATHRLLDHGHEVSLFGTRRGEIKGLEILHELDVFNLKIDTVTMYINPERQKGYYEMLIDLKPKRIIFNPGTENDELTELANKNGIKTENACTLVMLNLGIF